MSVRTPGAFLVESRPFVLISALSASWVEAPRLSVKTTLSPFPLKEKGRKEHLWTITFNLHVLETAVRTTKQNLTNASSFMVPRETVCGPRRKITCDSPLVRIFRWFVTLFDFLLIEWIFSLDNLSLSDSSSSFFLYFRTEREECGNVSGHVQHRKCVFHPKYSRSIFILQMQYAPAPLPNHNTSCLPHWPS